MCRDAPCKAAHLIYLRSRVVPDLSLERKPVAESFPGMRIVDPCLHAPDRHLGRDGGILHLLPPGLVRAREGIGRDAAQIAFLDQILNWVAQSFAPPSQYSAFLRRGFLPPRPAAIIVRNITIEKNSLLQAAELQNNSALLHPVPEKVPQEAYQNRNYNEGEDSDQAPALGLFQMEVVRSEVEFNVRPEAQDPRPHSWRAPQQT